MKKRWLVTKKHKRDFMTVIGLTGSFGTGKTTVAKMLSRRGAVILDADRIAYGLTGRRGRCFKAIVRAFGQEILANGDIDRKRLAAIVFNDPAKLKKLSAIIHPAVIQEIKKKIKDCHAKAKKRIVVIDAPLLIETGLHNTADILIVVKATFKKQVERILKKMPIERREIIRRINAQLPVRTKIKKADYVINNAGRLSETQKQIQSLWQRLKEFDRKT